MICLLSYVYSVGVFTSRTIALARGYSLASLPVVGQARLDFVAKTGLRVQSVTTEVLRKEHGDPVAGLVVPKYKVGRGSVAAGP
jgi:hypothetical protein